MTILDVNILLCAYNRDAPQQHTIARWLAKLLASGEAIALPWVTIWAFIRLCTNQRVQKSPLPVKEAFSIIDQWLVQPDILLLQPGPRHREILEELTEKHNVTGPLVTDAVLAALALENGAVLASTDQDFSRFQGLRWINPLSIKTA